MLALISVLFGVAASATAHITGLAPYDGAFVATAGSTFPLTFVTSNQHGPSWDWTAAVGVRPEGVFTQPASLGTWVANVDFVALDQEISGGENFTIEIPLTTSVISTTGSYIINVAIIHSFDQNAMTQISFYNLTIPINVESVPSSAVRRSRIYGNRWA
ncbi:hypothetical protein BKA62DRAFT_687776 [Auriculariales sp. MPI-PUGE-AT-0066]|nr:hypothetical protein BKA62DRAFT_687776 [Auriculariales sp. MPI-PUGE-AT-0066]